jgi:hypothetical protein
MSSRHQEQQGFLAELRASGDPALLAQAAQLQQRYHAREMAALSHDVYDSARGTGAAPAGWIRGSENLEMLRAAMPELQLDDETLLRMMKPDESGFRAEIYLPDPQILGPGYKPTVVFKGSANEVRMADGTLRDTAAEDFLGNNFPQSIGLKTDYYDRAMRFATVLKREGLEFDLSGHSLGGGMASAASAVTGMRTITFNAAGLHQNTAPEFARDNGGLPLFDTRNTVTAFEVRGDLLNDGVQGDLASLGARQREQMAGLLGDMASLVQDVPQARQLLRDRLLAGIPEASHPAIDGFIERLAQGDTAGLIRDLPQAAGTREPPLVAMTGEARELVRREQAASLGELYRLAGPLLEVASSAARGANAGRAVGQVVADGGSMFDRSLDVTGDLAAGALSRTGTFAETGYRMAGVTVDRGVQLVGETAAQGRQVAGNVEAFSHQAQGWLLEHGDNTRAAGLRVFGTVVGMVSESGRRSLEERAESLEARGGQAREQARDDAAAALERGQASAATIRGHAGSAGAAAREALGGIGAGHRDALVYMGGRLDAGLDVVGNRISTVTSQAPAGGAVLGGTTGALVGATVTYHPNNPFTAYNMASTVELVRQAGRGVEESVARHGMQSAMIPSLDHDIAQREQAARAMLQRAGDQVDAGQRTASPAAEAGIAVRPSWLGGDGVPALERYLDAVKSGEAERVSTAAAALMDTSGANAWLQKGHAQLEAMREAAAVEGLRRPGEEATAVPEQAR